MQIFGRSALNRVLTAVREYTQKFVQIRTSSSFVGALCVELWPKQVLYRILVPMLYISLYIWGACFNES